MIGQKNIFAAAGWSIFKQKDPKKFNSLQMKEIVEKKHFQGTSPCQNSPKSFLDKFTNEIQFPVSWPEAPGFLDFLGLFGHF